MSEAEKKELVSKHASRGLQLYKFRPLANRKHLKWLKEILDTGKFHCSKFSEFNDPREGGFTTFKIGDINATYMEKEKYKICSFSAREAFSNPLMWGYYANGFKGVAIEIEVHIEEVKRVKYVPEIIELDRLNYGNKVEEILTTKLLPWKHECEYRFLERSKNRKIQIGEITALYFGDPYGGAYNKDIIYENNADLKKYKAFKDNILGYIKTNEKLKQLRLFSVEIKKCKVAKKSIARK